MLSEESEFSSLKTVSSFDKGDDSTLAVRVDSDELQKFSPSSLLVESLIEQLCKLVEKNPKKRRKLYLDVCEKLHQMNLIDENYEKEEFAFMRSYYQKALYHFLTTAKTTSVDTKAAILSAVPDKLNIPAKGVIEWSRYSTEFEELDYIAKGGFGHVYKVQHKLDGGFYAVKKIFLRYYNVPDFLQNLKEVKMLAKFNHPNIVAYKAAWLEPFKKKKKLIPAIEMSMSSEESMKEDSLEVVFESSVSSKIEEIGDEVCKFSSNVDLMYRCKYDYEDKNAVTEWAVLYIQMQLCQQTLRQWLDIRNVDSPEIDINQCVEIFRQIVKGVEYIHSQGIVHHDLKPSNVFVSHDLKQIQVGDFGLACNLITHHQPNISVVETHQPGQLGTKLYAAPEQLNGYCHPKSDVYSLGIIFFELLQPFSTAMERSKVIGQLKSGNIPSDLVSSFPIQANIISQAISKSIKRRPSSSELLAVLDESQISDTQRVLAEQTETIMKLKRESIAKDEEIASLRAQLKELALQRTAV
ncbi:unnamed protein product [Nezara viridula]|uniref:non-specific serine/threonine protein kinase n=1 Tax=Nezara viridula TaxID=85310 RepID=A0A9P0H8L6_NEZVI|nr:unnamed protein product [Nezara viridula]